MNRSATRRSLRTARKQRGDLAKRLTQLARQPSVFAPFVPRSCDTEGMPPKIASVLGPYPNANKWRIVVKEEHGRKSMVADTREEAEAMKQSLLALFSDRSRLGVGQAVDEWLDVKRRDGLKESSLHTLARKLRSFLPLELTLGELTPTRAAKLYQDETERTGRFGVVRAASHQGLLRCVKGLFEWCVECGYLRVNPFRGVKPIGRPRKGKAQLRHDEALKLGDLLVREASNGEEGALALLVQVLMALRSAEVLGLRVRDIDARGTVLVIEGTKTQNARRSLRIESETLQHLLTQHCQGRSPESLLFGGERSQPRFTDFLRKRLLKYCARAGVPFVCPHSLRGLHASLAVARGTSTRAVAEALGHGSDEITKRHYISPEAMHGAKQQRIADIFAPSKPAPAVDAETIAAGLRNLDPKTLEQVLAAVGARR